MEPKTIRDLRCSNPDCPSVDKPSEWCQVNFGDLEQLLRDKIAEIEKEDYCPNAIKALKELLGE